jgi:hypothetical protein
MKIKEFLSSKLENFEKFISEELKKLIELNKITIKSNDNITNDLRNFKNNINYFISSIGKLPNDLDNAIKVFLLQYEIDINLIREDIDYPKLKKYLEMFSDVLKN